MTKMAIYSICADELVFLTFMFIYFLAAASSGHSSYGRGKGGV